MKINAMLFLGLCAASATGHAEIYKHVDDSGRVTYSNIPIKGAKKLNLDPLPVVPATKPKAASAAPAGFPKVDADTQKKRDDLRHRILEDELASEERLLLEARQTLKDAEAARGGKDAVKLPAKYLERLQQIKEGVTRHEKNIEALKIEIANLKH